MSKNNRKKYWIILGFIIILSFSGCSGTDNLNQEVEDVDSVSLETDADAETDTETNADADIDAETNADTDTNTDADTNADADIDTETNADTNTDTDTDTNTNTEATELNGYYLKAYNQKGKALKDILNDIITENHGTLSYDQVYSALEDTDKDPLDPSKLILFYKGISVPGNELRESGDGDIWNREHIWAKSHGDFGTRRGPGTDLHMIRPTDASVNTRRGHLDFDESDHAFTEVADTYVDEDSFEPRDGVKGDVARMLFYMAVRYEGEEGEVDLEVSNRTDTYDLTDTGYGEHGKLDTLLKWHIQDPVDEFEETRNNVIYEIQGNRNPFIDHPEYVSRIWGQVDYQDINQEADKQEANEESANNQDINNGEGNNNEVSQIATIKLARQENDGIKTTISGVITYVESQTTMYVQDQTGGLRVDSYGSDLDLRDYRVGHTITVIGKLDTYKGEKEIRVEAKENIINLDSSLEVKAKEVSLADLKDGKYQGELIQVNNVKILSIEKNIMVIEDFQGDLLNVFYGNALGFNAKTMTINEIYTIIGIGSTFNDIQIKLMDNNGVIK